MLVYLLCILFVFINVKKVVKSDEVAKYSTPVGNFSGLGEKNNKYESTTFKYPTATWTAFNYEMMKRKFNHETKLYLFKPSPFLKPPFTDGEVGASIMGIEDGVNVHGRRRGNIRWKENKSFKPYHRIPHVEKIGVMSLKENDSRQLDKFLEQALSNYIESANLTDEFGSITVDAFSEALKNVIEAKKNWMPPYDENKEMRRKFRDDILSPKKSGIPTSGGLLERQYQRRLKKTYENINENTSVPLRPAFLNRQSDWPVTSLPSKLTTYDNNNLEESADENVDSTARAEFLGRGIEWESTDSPLALYSFEDADNVTAAEKRNDEQDVILATNPSRTEKPSTSYFEKPTIAPLKLEPKKSTKKASRGKTKWRETISLPSTALKNDWTEGEVKLSVAETVYYRPRERPVHSFVYQPEPEFGAIPGEPEKDYPMLSVPPPTGFKCPQITNGEGPKMLADPKTRCQVFYICTGDGPPAPMLCPNGTMFNENVLVCDWWYNVDC